MKLSFYSLKTIEPLDTLITRKETGSKLHSVCKTLSPSVYSVYSVVYQLRDSHLAQQLGSFAFRLLLDIELEVAAVRIDSDG